jgi:hypothetical protein
MFRRVSLWIGCGVLLAASLQASEASAQFGPGGYGLGFFNYGSRPYANVYRVPYFAMYPPVYYSYPVARPYGYSPFAYPPGTMTPAAAPKVAAVEYQNPFTEPVTTPASPTENKQTAIPAPVSAPIDQTASLPRMYYNPFVQAAQTASSK